MNSFSVHHLRTHHPEDWNGNANINNLDVSSINSQIQENTKTSSENKVLIDEMYGLIKRAEALIATLPIMRQSLADNTQAILDIKNKTDYVQLRSENNIYRDFNRSLLTGPFFFYNGLSYNLSWGNGEALPIGSINETSLKFFPTYLKNINSPVSLSWSNPQIWKFENTSEHSKVVDVLVNVTLLSEAGSVKTCFAGGFTDEFTVLDPDFGQPNYQPQDIVQSLYSDDNYLINDLVGFDSQYFHHERAGYSTLQHKFQLIIDPSDFKEYTYHTLFKADTQSHTNWHNSTLNFAIHRFDIELNIH